MAQAGDRLSLPYYTRRGLHFNPVFFMRHMTNYYYSNSAVLCATCCLQTKQITKYMYKQSLCLAPFKTIKQFCKKNVNYELQNKNEHPLYRKKYGGKEINIHCWKSI